MGLEFEKGRGASAPQISLLMVPCPLSSLYDAQEFEDCHVFMELIQKHSFLTLTPARPVALVAKTGSAV